MPKKLLFVFKLAMGHMQLSIAISKTIQKLYGDQFEIFFAVNQTYKSIIEKLIPNVNFVLFEPVSTDGNENLQGSASDWLNKFGETWRERDLIKFNLGLGHPYWKFLKDCRNYYPHITRIIQEIKPDLVLVDNLMASPVGIDQGILSVQILSCGPALFGDERLPPPRSGLPGDYTEENVKLWKNFIEKTLKNEDYLKFLKETNDWMKETKCPVNIDGRYYCNTPSCYLNVYNWPLELDYANMEGNWVRMGSSITYTPDPFPIPQSLAKLPGRLIYFSLGSISSCYKPLMTRMLSILGEIEHRFIISTGPTGDQYAHLLSANQYGEKIVNQLAVLQSVEVFITHGGNNSLTEACHFGVPMIVCPLFGDQHNNAKRIEEKNCGKQLDPFTCTKSDLEQAIEFCLREDVKARLRTMSNRIKRDNNLTGVCEAIVKLIN